MQQARTNSATLILGGVRSGKSRYAQHLAASHARVTVIATAEMRDDAEMQARIERHQADRPAGWVTVEEPLDLAGAIARAAETADVVLVDCLTLFASNLLEAGEASTAMRIDALCELLAEPPCAVILVANEVGLGVVPASELGRRFRDLAGELNQRVAALADVVVLMVAGLPLVLKGAR